MLTKPLGIALGLTAAVLVGFGYLAKPASKLKGDLAKVGDSVLVPVTTLSSQVPGGLPAAFPQGAGYVEVKVDTSDPGQVTGFITNYVMQESPMLKVPATPPVGPVVLQKAWVSSVYRNGALVS